MRKQIEKSVITLTVILIFIQLTTGCGASPTFLSDALTALTNNSTNPVNYAIQYQLTVAADLPLGYWLLNETSGATGALEARSLPYTAVYGTQTAFGLPGPIYNESNLADVSTYAISAVGGASPNLTFPSSLILDSSSGNSVEIWLNIPSLFATGSATLLQFGTAGTAQSFKVAYAFDTSTLSVTSINSNGQTDVLSANYLSYLDLWTHVVFVTGMNPGDPALIYINSYIAAQGALNYPQPNTYLNLNAGILPTGNWLSLSHLSLYSQQLSITQVSNHYHAAGF